MDTGDIVIVTKGGFKGMKGELIELWETETMDREQVTQWEVKLDDDRNRNNHPLINADKLQVI